MKKNWRVAFFRCFFRLIAGAIDRNINITIFVYVPEQRFKIMFFLCLKYGCFEGKNTRYHKQLINLDGNIILQSRHRAAMFVLSFANLNLALYLATPQVIV